MSQNDFTIANQSFPSFRSDLNDALQAIATNNAGSTAPSTTFAYQWWYDETNDVLKIRNGGNDAWIDVATFDQTTDTFLSIGSKAPNIQEFTTSGTYTPSDGVKSAYVEVFGAGGGGGGANRAGDGTRGAGSGAGAGGYAAKLIDVSGLTGDPTITIGAGGTGGIAPSTDGTAGGNSSYDDTGVGGSDTLTGNGGTGGKTNGITGTNAFLGGAGGTASGGDINVTGNPGGGAIIRASNGLTLGGNGGSSPLGGAGLGQSNDTAGGDASANSGSGGGGGAAINSDYAGGDGADGYVRITEYF